MSVYTVVGEIPKELGKNDFVILKPAFLEEIAKTKNKRGVSRLTTASSLRDIFMLITDKYDPKVNPYHLKLSKYEGIKYESDEDLVPLIYRIIEDNKLNLIESAVDVAIKNRPHGTEVIYYVTSDLDGVGAFAKNGINAGKLDKKGKKSENSEYIHTNFGS
jgi:hypothetical protein